MARESAFSLLGLPERFSVDSLEVMAAWKSRLTLVHPDRFAGRPEAERRVAEQWASRINDAKAVLLDPVARATALLGLQGLASEAEADTQMDAAFLAQQFEWRERLEAGQVSAVRSEWEAARASLLAALETAIDQQADWTRARELLRRLLFLEKLGRELTEASRHPE